MKRPRVASAFALAIAGVVALSGCGISRPTTPAPEPVPAASPVLPAIPRPLVTVIPPVVTPTPYDSAPPTPTAVATPDVSTTDQEPTPEATPTTQPTTPAVDCAKQKCIALTFDDGPWKGTTPKLLNILKKYGVHATFFIEGQRVKDNKKLIARAAAEGHVIGNHAYNHPEFWKLSASSIQSQIKRTNTLLKKTTGKRPTLLRPPFGESNPTIRHILRDLGMAQILWSIDPLDWKDQDAKTVAARVLAGAQPGAIVLSHDIYPTTVDAYKTIIPKLQAQGYVFVTVPQLLKSVKPGVSYSQR